MSEGIVATTPLRCDFKIGLAGSLDDEGGQPSCVGGDLYSEFEKRTLGFKGLHAAHDGADNLIDLPADVFEMETILDQAVAAPDFRRAGAPGRFAEFRGPGDLPRPAGLDRRLEFDLAVYCCTYPDCTGSLALLHARRLGRGERL